MEWSLKNRRSYSYYDITASGLVSSFEAQLGWMAKPAPQSATWPKAEVALQVRILDDLKQWFEGSRNEGSLGCRATLSGTRNGFPPAPAPSMAQCDEREPYNPPARATRYETPGSMLDCN